MYTLSIWSVERVEGGGGGVEGVVEFWVLWG